MKKLVITVAVNGSLTSREMNPNVPLTPGEIGEDAARCREAGAAMVHTHARNSEGKASLCPDTFEKIHHAIVARSDIIVQLSTGGRADMNIEARGEPVSRIRPEMASLTTGSVNFPDQVYVNSEQDVEYLAGVLAQAGTKPEMEIFEAGMVANALRLAEKGLVSQPMHFDFVLGMRGGQPANARTLLFLSESIPPESTWTVAALGRHQLPMATLAIVMGGHVRVGLEDNLYYRKGELATNEQLVQRIARLAGELGREVASPDEAREILGLQGRQPS
ncbi:MAG: 3-keto-5-aminohexanoate cleavage protein [Planctomycetota bacterium]|nr:3-keto-5-aminohexanoate cleavage protein [Planctomycetota bacterium]